MSTDYGWQGLTQVCATLRGARHVPAVALSIWGAITNVHLYLYL